MDNSIVFFENLPITNEGKLNCWLKNEELLQRKYQVFIKPDNFTVTIMNFDGYRDLPEGTRDGSIDEFTWFDDDKNKPKKCVYNDIAMIIRGSIKGKIFINTGNKQYPQTSDGKIKL